MLVESSMLRKILILGTAVAQNSKCKCLGQQKPSKFHFDTKFNKIWKTKISNNPSILKLLIKKL